MYGDLGQLPYHVVDGVNKDGIMISTHVLFNDFNFTGSGDESNPIELIPFHVLNYGLDDLEDYISNLYVSPTIQASGYLLQSQLQKVTQIRFVTRFQIVFLMLFLLKIQLRE